MQNKQSTKQKLRRQNNINKNNRSLLLGTFCGVIIIITPYLYYLYEGFPSTKTLETFFGTFESNYWEDVNISAWVLFGKFIPFILLTIWFFTCKHWWYHAILVPICMYAFQIYSNLSNEIRFSDSDEIYALAPIIFVVAIFSYTVRTRVFDKIHGIDLSELSRVNWKGELQNRTKNDSDIDDNDLDDDEDEEPVFMG